MGNFPPFSIFPLYFGNFMRRLVSIGLSTTIHFLRTSRFLGLSDFSAAPITVSR